MIYHSQNIENAVNRKGHTERERVISHKSIQISAQIQITQIVLSATFAHSPVRSPSLHCARPCGDSRTSLCSSELPPAPFQKSQCPVCSQLGRAKITGSPHTKTRRLQLPEWGW